MWTAAVPGHGQGTQCAPWTELVGLIVPVWCRAVVVFLAAVGLVLKSFRKFRKAFRLSLMKAVFKEIFR